MARRPTPLDESPAWDIYQELKQFAVTQQAIPNPSAFYENVMLPKGYPLSRGGFDYWWLRLQLAGWIRVDPATRAVVVRDLEIRDKP